MSDPLLSDSALVTMETAELEKQISASQAQILLIRKCFLLVIVVFTKAC